MKSLLSRSLGFVINQPFSCSSGVAASTISITRKTAALTLIAQLIIVPIAIAAGKSHAKRLPSLIGLFV